MGAYRWAVLVGTTSVVVSLGIGAPASAAGVCDPSTPQYCPTPAVVTGQAVNVTSSAATLTGNVVPNGAPTTCAFGYGTSTKYGKTTSPETVGSGTSAVFVTAAISGLAANTTYHYVLVCVNSAGAFGFGSDRTFTSSGPGKAHSKVRIGKRKESVSSGRAVKFTVICLSSVACRGRLTLKTPSGGKLANAVRYSVAAGSRKTVKMKLTKKAFGRLQSSRHHKLRARAHARDNDGATAGRLVTLTLA